MSITYTDIFCGAGGSSIGLTEAGLELKLAANHWDRAIETHSTNFPDADHLCADVSNYDMRRLPRTDVLWASPICTELSPAGGRRRARGQLDLLEELGHVPKAGLDRTRATFWDVLRASEVHRYKLVLIENVVEAADWELFDVWLAGMHTLGYEHQIVCVSSAHVGDAENPHAPQWRDRMYVVFHHKGIRRPDVELRPAAWCPRCDKLVSARQSWKRVDRRHRVGKYGQQYVYRCPETACRHTIVEPYVLPAAAAIDWTDVGTRIGDRTRPLAAATMRRIEAGLAMFAQPAIVAHHGNTWERPGSGYYRAWPAGETPLNARTGTAGDGLAVPPGAFYLKNYGDASEAKYRAHPVTDPVGAITANDSHSLVAPPFVGELRNHSTNHPADSTALAAVTAGGNQHYLAIPGAFIQKHHGGLEYGPIGHMVKDVRDPLASIVARPNLSLVIPYRRGAAKTTAEPLHTVATKESAALVSPAVDVNDCHFRMLQPREHMRAQRFPDSYRVLGNKGEQTMQAGNAVSSNVSHWIGRAAVAVLS